MDIKLLKKVLKEVKYSLDLDYALSEGYMCPTCTTKMLVESYGENTMVSCLFSIKKAI